MASSRIIIYQVLTRLHGNRCQTRKPFGTLQENGCGKMNDFTPTVLKQLREMGISHVWYTGILRHATMTDYSRYGIPRQHPAVVKGKAGSPYAVCDYYDVDPDLAVDVSKRMDEFERLVNRTHRAGLKMIIDFVPNHVARQYHSIAKPADVQDLGEGDDPSKGFDMQNNFYYCPGQSFSPYFDLYHGEKEPYTEMPARATGNDCFHNAPGMNDWYETVKLCYGVDYYAGVTPSTFHLPAGAPIPSTWQKMLHILLFWAAKGVDGFRCDMAEMVPAEFWAWATPQVKEKHPGVVFVGEVYNPAEYRHFIASGFDYLYDKVGMYDTLCDVLRHHRPVQAITQAWQQCDDIRQHMLYFLENHDEQRLASDFVMGDGWKALPALVVAAILQQNPFMLYAGQEWGERGMDAEGFSGRDGRTTIFDYWALQPERENALADYYRRVMHIAKNEPAVVKGESFDLMYVNQHLSRQYAFMRKSKEQLLLVVANFDDLPVGVNLNIPAHAFDYLTMAEGDYQGHDLLSDADCQFSLQRDAAVGISLQPRQSVVLSLQQR
ncbi:MAG: alpha-amylase family protein [Prevotella sp.]|nr:alpha-amylase family protein [Prevotella sp.]